MKHISKGYCWLCVSYTISPQFYITFWSLSMYDLHVPTAAYEKQVQAQQSQIDALEDNRDMVRINFFLISSMLYFFHSTSIKSITWINSLNGSKQWKLGWTDKRSRENPKSIAMVNFKSMQHLQSQVDTLLFYGNTLVFHSNLHLWSFVHNFSYPINKTKLWFYKIHHM